MKRLLLAALLLSLQLLPGTGRAEDKMPDKTQVINVGEGEGEDITARKLGPEIGTVEATDPSLETGSLIKIRESFRDKMHESTEDL